MLSPKTNGNPQEDERELMGETGTLFRDLGRIFKVTSCDVAIIWPDIYIYIYLGSGFHPLYNPTKTRGQFFHGSSVSTPPIYRITGIPQKAFASGMRRKTPLPTPCSAPFWRLPTSPFLAPRLGFC